MKKYQVFVSSTFRDLEAARREVLHALIGLGCIPSGMELFPAADEDQWTYIKKVIDDCDYYVLIVAGRYGSLDRDNISFTEKEYSYAVQAGKPVIVFSRDLSVCGTAAENDEDEEARARLIRFRELVTAGRVAKFWKSEIELAAHVMRSLQITMQERPAVGWIRADLAETSELLNDLNELRKQNDALRQKIQKMEERSVRQVDGLAEMDENFNVIGTYRATSYTQPTLWNAVISWNDIFFHLGPILFETKITSRVLSDLAKELVQRFNGLTVHEADINYEIGVAIRAQFEVLGLIQAQYLHSQGGGAYTYWSLTPAGKNYALHLRAIRTRKKQ